MTGEEDGGGEAGVRDGWEWTGGERRARDGRQDGKGVTPALSRIPNSAPTIFS